MKTEELLRSVPKEILAVIEDYGLQVRFELFLIFSNVVGMYGRGTIFLTPISDLRILMHELGHAIEDMMGALDDSKKKTGEFTAHLFSFMMLYNEQDPFKVLNEALDQYLTSTTELRYVDELDVRGALQRATLAFNHPLASEVRKTIRSLVCSEDCNA